MGWKASTIIIKNPSEVDYENLLSQIGYSDLKKIENEKFERVINPEENKVYIGKFKNNLIICSQDTPMHFFKNSDSDAVNSIINHFPNSEICSIILHSSVNLWGFAIIKNGEKLRIKAGSAEDGTFVEYGKPLEEEKELLSKSTIDENGVRTYIFDDIDDEVMTEDQVGENFVFAITKRYFGEEINRNDELLETTLIGYSYQKLFKSHENKKDKRPSKWLIYSIIFLLILTWQILKRTVFMK